ncbi:MAG: hypothetical protein AB7G13_11985 [Lautropia sp.]
MSVAGPALRSIARCGARVGLPGLLAVAAVLELAATKAIAAGPVASSAEEILLADTSIDGGLLDVIRFTDPRSVGEILDATAAAWRLEGGLPPLRSVRGGWQSITRLTRGGVETVEVRPQADGIEGRRIRLRSDGSDAAARYPSQAALALLPPGAQATAPVAHRDGSRDLATVVAWSAESIGQLARQLRSRLVQAGFVAAPIGLAPAVPAAATAAGAAAAGDTAEDTAAGASAAGASAAPAAGVALIYLKGREEVAATVSNHGDRRAIVIHWGIRR